ncbi:hypothetical protein PMAYCL1PPCAC_20486, partial [Pristionchus mayeri]
CSGRGMADNSRYLMMEYCPRSLSSVIKECRRANRFLNAEDFMKWGNGLTSGMVYLTDFGYFHGDLKPDNLLIDTVNVLKISDFGISMRYTSLLELEKCSAYVRGTPRYMAPETHSGKEITAINDFQTDVWSYGICIWEMITCKIPFKDVPDAALALHIG